LSARTVTPRAASAAIPPKRSVSAWLIGSSAENRLPSVEKAGRSALEHHLVPGAPGVRRAALSINRVSGPCHAAQGRAGPDVPRSQNLGRSAPSEEIHHQHDNEDHDEDVEQELSNPGGRSSDAAKTEHRGYDRDYQCNHCPIEQVSGWHGFTPDRD
jgi:hypothetical protein